MDRATIWEKMNAAAEAWRARYGTDPAKHAHALELVMAVALHETELGEAWGRSGNWGAIQRRSMTEAERAETRLGRTPAPSDAFEQLHGDSSPIHGRYAVWFWAFPPGVPTAKGQAGDVAGADKLLEVLLDERRSISAAIDAITPEGLAAAMYASRYYEGFYDPRHDYQLVGGHWVKLETGEAPQPGARVTSGKALDIDAYATALERATGQIHAALAGWSPGAEPPVVTEPAGPPDLGDVRELQRALNGVEPRPAPPLDIDGKMGPKTRAAIVAFQKAHGLAVDGVAGPLTLEALRAAAGL